MVFLLGDHTPHRHVLLKVVALLIFATALPISANRIDKRINPRGCGRSEPMGRVYNGQPISRESIPWIVQLDMTYGSDTFQCGGSIITRNVILTAGHCLFMLLRFPDSVDVWIGSTRAFHGTSVKAARLKVHPRFLNQREMVYDVGLLKLAKDLKFNRKTKPVCLPEEKLDVGGKSLLVAGWGKTETANTSKVLLYTQVDGLTDEACGDFLQIFRNPYTRRRIKPGPIICAKGSSTNSCAVEPNCTVPRGDSGGPLTLQDERGRSTQVGMVSVGYNCSVAFPVLYSSAAFHRQWIKKMLNHPGKWTKLQVH
ncbi:hypothetical protein MTO96_007865 [Rhipicephalus appendiculatus]